MTTVTISFYIIDPPLVFTGVTSFKYDPNTGTFSITHDGGEYNDTPENVNSIDIT